MNPASTTADWTELAASAGLVNAETLRDARRQVGDDPFRLGHWLVEHGCLTPRDLALLQAESLGIPFVEPGDYRVNLENRALLAEDLARAHTVFPLFHTEDIITLAVAQPLDLAVLDQVRLQTGSEVDQVLATPREIQHLIEWAFGGIASHTGNRPDAVGWEDILKDVADAPAVKLVNVLLEQAAGYSASDIHVDAEEQALRVRFRIDGVLREVPAPPKSLLPAIVSRIKVLANLDISETRRPQDGHFKLAIDREELDVRVSTLPSAGGETVVLRLLRSGTRLLSLEELGLDAGCREAFDRLIHLPHGMLLVTGPTGSGKTTTLYSALTRLDRVRQSVVTLEDPVEIRLPQIRQVAVNPKAGLTFHAGLRAILRQDPDVIMLGEVRDLETAETALQAALTGHLLLATLHTNSAAGAPARLLDMGVPDFLVSSALAGVLAQRLCRRLCRHCLRPAGQRESLLARLPQNVAARLADATLFEPQGCKRCGSTGYEGRVGVFELLVVSDEFRRAILERRDERTLAILARRDGMRLLLEDGLDKIREGLTSIEELLRVAGGVDLGAALGPSAGCSRGPSATLEHSRPGCQFDVAQYEQLLGAWLRGTEVRVTPSRASEHVIGATTR